MIIYILSISYPKLNNNPWLEIFIVLVITHIISLIIIKKPKNNIIIRKTQNKKIAN